jgi:hypothetical protein
MGAYFRTLFSRFGSGWTRFWFMPSDAIVLTLLRILVAVVALWWYLGFFTDLQKWFAPGGYFPLEMAKQYRVMADELQEGRFAFSVLDYVDSPAQLNFVYGLGLVALVMMLTGTFSRVATIASLVAVLSFIHRGPIMWRPVDNILVILMFYLCIGPAGANFSVDAMVRHRRRQKEFGGHEPLGPPLVVSSAATVAIRLMQVHLALIYAAMVAAQLQVAAWWQGTAVWWMMARSDSRLVDLTFLNGMGQAFEYFVNFCTHVVILYEVCFPLLIWNQLARPILIVLGAFVWGGMALISGSVSFAVLMFIAGLAFLSPEGLRSFCTRSDAKRSVSGATAAAVT